MKRKYNLHRLFILLLAMILSADSIAQTVIVGAMCVTKNTTYSYSVSGLQAGALDMQVCVTGGRITDNDSACRNGMPFNSFHVIWTDSLSGTITVTGTAGNASLQVNIAQPLMPGKIDSLSRIQLTDTITIPAIVYCSLPTGGHCSPQYQYQWQESSDGLRWNNTAGAVSKDLQLWAPLKTTWYYRRLVVELISTTEMYSDIAIISLK